MYNIRVYDIRRFARIFGCGRRIDEVFMPRFFVPLEDIDNTADKTVITVRGDDAGHITRVLRMKAGESVIVCDSDGREYETVIRTTGSEVVLDVISSKMSENEPPYRAVVFQALVKGDRFDTVLQKSTELGVCEIVPVMTSRCTVKLTPQEYAKKVERWQRIAYEAAKQCGRAVIPVVHTPVAFADAVKMALQCDLGLFCYEGKGTLPLNKICRNSDQPSSVSLMIGPEGGYSKEEAKAAEEAGLKMTGLGKRILRTETAAPYVLSCLSYEFEL